MVASAPGLCVVEGCGQPQHCTGQLTYRWCKKHRDERREASRSVREQDDTPEQHCVEVGCTAPRMVGPKSGKTLTRCETHQREYDRVAKSEKRLVNGTAPKQPAVVPARPSKA